MHGGKYNWLTGLLVAALLSLFMNFSLLTHTFGIDSEQKAYSRTERTGPEPDKRQALLPGTTEPVEIRFGRSVPDLRSERMILYNRLAWFFLFSFFLFLLNTEGYKAGEKLFRRSECRTLSFVLAGSVAATWLLFRAYPWVCSLFSLPEPFFHPMLWMEHLFLLVVVVLTGMLMRQLSSKQKMQLEYERLKSKKWQSSYHALMAQIQPHFFFNSLNGLNALIRAGDQAQTLTYLDELSAVFRYILQSNRKELVTLAEELEFVKAYTYLLEVRYEGKLFFSVQVDQAYLFWYLPILSVLPLVENAVKHNVISRQYPLRIDLYTSADGCLVVSNQIRPKIEASSGSGIGLKNLWARYQLLTGKDLLISRRKEYFKVMLPLLKKTLHP